MFLHANEVKLVSFKLDYYKYRTGNITLLIIINKTCISKFILKKRVDSKQFHRYNSSRGKQRQKMGEIITKNRKTNRKMDMPFLSAIILKRKYIRLNKRQKIMRWFFKRYVYKLPTGSIF